MPTMPAPSTHQAEGAYEDDTENIELVDDGKLRLLDDVDCYRRRLLQVPLAFLRPLGRDCPYGWLLGGVG